MWPEKSQTYKKKNQTQISFSSLFFLWFLEQTKEESRKEIWSPLFCEKLRFTQVNWWHQSLHEPHPLDSKLSLQTPQIQVPGKLFLENMSMTQDSTCSDVFFSVVTYRVVTGKVERTLGSQSKQHQPWNSSFAAPFLSDLGWVTEFSWSIFSSNKGYGFYNLFSKLKKMKVFVCLFLEKSHTRM